MNNKNGFTLLEVLIALSILAIALSAAIKASVENAENVRYLRDRTLAHWVAMNVITKVQIQPTWPELGENTGKTKMANRTWYWIVKVSETLDKGLRRLDVQVRDKPEAGEPLVILVGFVGMSGL